MSLSAAVSNVYSQERSQEWKIWKAQYFAEQESLLNEIRDLRKLAERKHEQAEKELIEMRDAVSRMTEAAAFYCNMYEYEAATYAVDKTARDTQFMAKATESERIEEAAKWSQMYLAEKGIKHVNSDVLRGLVRATWKHKQGK